MPRGESGRIVLEIDAGEKRELYEALDREGTTLRAWFLGRVREYLDIRRAQLRLFPEAGYSTTSAGSSGETTTATRGSAYGHPTSP